MNCGLKSSVTVCPTRRPHCPVQQWLQSLMDVGCSSGMPETEVLAHTCIWMTRIRISCHTPLIPIEKRSPIVKLDKYYGTGGTARPLGWEATSGAASAQVLGISYT